MEMDALRFLPFAGEEAEGGGADGEGSLSTGKSFTEADLAALSSCTEGGETDFSKVVFEA